MINVARKRLLMLRLPTVSHLMQTHTSIMNGRAKISSFFTTAPVKRGASETEKGSPKKAKQQPPSQENAEYASPAKSEPLAPALTPEQKEKMAGNKRAALARLQDKSVVNDNSSSAADSLVVNIGETWRKALCSEFSKSYFKQLSSFVAAERAKGTVFPPADQVFAWTQMCEISKVKVVILGQDPYHGPNQAHGLLQEHRPVLQCTTGSTVSTKNMFKELATDIKGFKHPGHGTLTGWAKQGVLLLNACLTVRAKQANSHAGKGWEQLTDATISWLNKNSTGVVFMLWGAYAQKKGACIDKKKHHVLKTVHPSPLSAHRGFLGCKHFSQCNTLLQQDDKTPIDWTKLPPQ